MAEASPAMTGRINFASVHTAATAMVPAPTKRTLWLQVACARWAIESAPAPGQGGIMRHAPHPADQGAGQHRDAHPQSDQVPDREQGEGQKEVEAGHATACAAHPKIAHHIAREHARGHDTGEGRRNDRTPDHRRESGAAFLHRGRVGMLAAPDLEHLGAGHAFRIGQIGLRHQRPPQRDRVHDAERAAECADRERHPVGKTGPPADHDQAGQYKDDGGQGAGGRGDRLHDVVLLDGHAPKTA